MAMSDGMRRVLHLYIALRLWEGGPVIQGDAGVLSLSSCRPLVRQPRHLCRMHTIAVSTQIQLNKGIT